MARSFLWSVTAMVLVFLLGHSEVVQVRAVVQVAQFIFGDSLVEQGNNNNLQTLAKANSKPNGIDFAQSNYQPTGRFSNGRLVSDFISEYMGIPSVVAYLDSDANGQNLLRGCSFASAGSGILDDTGAIFVRVLWTIGHKIFRPAIDVHMEVHTQGQRISLNQQIANFQDVQSKITAQLGQAASDQLINKAIFAFTTGGNDFINNYLLPVSERAAQYSIGDFTTLLINNFEGQLKTVYSLGARKISIANIGPLGCIPNMLQSKSLDGSCVDSTNQIAIGFNSLLKPMLDTLTPQLPGAIITYSDSYSMVLDIIQNPSSYGFASADTACCGTGRFNGLIPCSAITSLCPDRSKYLFWDPFHPTEAANNIVVQKLLFGPPANISPMNLSTIIPL